MIDEQEESLDQENNPSATEEPSSDALGTDEIDVVSALAAVSSLQDLTQDDEVEDELDIDDEVEDELLIEDDDSASIEADIAASTDEDYAEYTEIHREQSAFPHPPLSVVHRGQLASIVPAVLLIGAGALLTVILTTSDDATINLPVVSAMVISGFGVALVAYWLSSARWSTGGFFMGMILALLGGTSVYLALPNNLDIISGWPLFLTAIGTAFVLTDLVSPSNRRLWLVGLMLAIGGFAGMVITGQLLDDTVIQTLSRLWPIVLGVVVVLLIVPIFRRNGQ